MKRSTVWLWFALVLVTLLCAYKVRTAEQRRDAALETLRNQQTTELSALQSEVEAARAALLAQSLSTESLSVLNPRRLVQELYELDKNPRKRVRQALFCFRGLLAGGTNSIPPILDYFVDAADAKLGNYSRSYPKTTRLGLTHVLRDMGPEGIISMTRLFPVVNGSDELKQLIDVLLEIDPDFYRPYCIRYARDMYDKANSYTEKVMFLILLMDDLKDRDFAMELIRERKYIGEDGRLNTVLINSIKRALGEDEMITVALELLNGPTISNKRDRYILLMDVGLESSLGTDPAITKLYTDLFQDAPPGSQVMLLCDSSFLRYNDKNGNREMPAEVAEARFKLLDSLETEYGGNEMVDRAITLVRSSLENTLKWNEALNTGDTNTTQAMKFPPHSIDYSDIVGNEGAYKAFDFQN